MRRTILFAIVLLLAASAFAGTGKMLIINSDAPGIGFNDPAPVAPVGGNPGTTRGEQRLNVYVKAAERWSAALDINFDIRVRGSFAPLDCEGTSAVLGQTFVFSWHANFPNAPRTDVWYPAALANQFASSDLNTTQDDMFIQFNSAIDNPTCLGERSWYYGYDGNEEDDDSLYHVVLHEIAHGLGMSSRATTAFFQGRPSVFDLHTLDIQAGLRWDQMSDQQRGVSYLNTGNLVWVGPNVTRKAIDFLQAAPVFTVTQPAAVARNYDIGTAGGFGPPPSTASMSGRVVAAVDAANEAGPTTSDGCTPFTNAAAIAGNIALIDRGVCTFVEKARNAQNAGAVGVIIADNRKETCLPPSLGGDATDITIPVVSVTQDQGDAFDAQLAQNAEVRGMLRLDPSRLAGASDEGYVRLYAPCTANPGSSKHHWDIVATPNLLMEPFINSDLDDSLDLSIYQMQDIGWSLPARSGRRFLKRR